MDSSEKHSEGIPLPAPTAWPMMLALGLALGFAGLVTHYALSILGALLILGAAVGWWRQVFPHQRHEMAPLEVFPELDSKPIHRGVAHLRIGKAGHRVRVPTHIQPYSAGIKGGLVGSAAMAAVALLYGLSHGSIWYPVNLLVAAIVPELAEAPTSLLRAYNGGGLALGIFIHLIASTLVGLLYAVLLPMFPRRVWLWSGLVAPLLWTGALASTMGVVNPTLNTLIDWRWFIASQLAFGLVCGAVVARAESIETMQTWLLALRSGIESAETMGDEE
jgi:hypothetical protein